MSSTASFIKEAKQALDDNFPPDRVVVQKRVTDVRRYDPGTGLLWDIYKPLFGGHLVVPFITFAKCVSQTSSLANSKADGVRVPASRSVPIEMFDHNGHWRTKDGKFVCQQGSVWLMVSSKA